MSSDQAIFASTAERLIRGDRLYVDVWDNKDPFIYYVIALTRFMSPLTQVPLEIMWVLISCLAIWWITRQISPSAPGAGVLAFAAVPVILTGFAYEAGLSELPGVSLGLLTVAYLVRHRWVRAGVVMGLLAMFKVILVPVLVLATLTIAIRRREGRGALTALSASILTTMIGLGIVAVRGELTGYVRMLAANSSYAGGGASGSVFGNLVLNLSASTGPSVAAACLVSLALLLLPRPGSTRGNRELNDLATMTFVVFAGVSLVLFATGKWSHHGTYLTMPVALSAAYGVMALGPGLTGQQIGRIAAIAAITTAVLGGSGPLRYLFLARDAPSAWASLTSLSPSTAALESVGRGHSYARIGQTEDSPHAYRLDGWELACPVFHQYPFQSYDLLAETLTCLPDADSIIVDASAAPVEGRQDWNHFVADVEDLLATGYECTPFDGFRICVQKDL